MADNYGIKPLPNLETKFVAANTLIGLNLSHAESLLQEDAVQQLQKKIAAIREKYFLPNNRRQKLRYIEDEERLREQLEQVLEDQRADWNESEQREIDRKVAQFPNPELRKQLRQELLKRYKERKTKFDSSLEDAQKMAHWNPYDQNVSADWFDAMYMFGVGNGFDVIIGNPPYINSRDMSKGDQAEIRESIRKTYKWTKGSWDIYIAFFELGFRLMTDHGVLTFITPDKWLSKPFGKVFRTSVVRNISSLLKAGREIFESTNVDSIVSQFTHKEIEI